MITMGAFEAKTKFSELLDKVEAGEHVVITRHGKVIARLVRDSDQLERRKAAVAELMKLRAGSTLGGSNWRELRDEGRKV